MNLIRRLGTALGFAGLALALFSLSPELALAQVANVAAAQAGFPEIREFFVFVAGWLINLVAFLSMIFANMIAQLFEAGFILDTGIGPTLELTWSVLRNFVNLAFVAALIVVAVMVVLDIGENTGLGALKKALPKMILGIIAVNLTFFGARVILTVSDIATVAVFSIPQAVAGEQLVQSPCANVTSQQACLLEIKEVLRGLPNIGNVDKNAESLSKAILEMNAKFAENQSAQFPIKLLSKDSFAQVLLMNILNFKSVIQFNGVSGGADLTLAIIFSLVTALLVFAIYLMLVLALIVRMIYIWLAIALAPIGIMLWVLSDIFPGLPSGSERLSVSAFLGHAFMPALIALPMSLSMIMIYANNALTTVSGDLSTFSNIANNFHTIVWWIASIGILWVGTKEMIEKSSSYAASVTGAVGGMVENIGSSLGKLALHAPIVPTVGGVSVAEGLGMLRAPQVMVQQAEERTRQKTQDRLEAAGILQARAPSRETQLQTAKDTQGDLKKFFENLTQKSLTGADKLDPAALREFEETLRKANLTPEQAKDLPVSELIQRLVQRGAQTGFRAEDLTRWKAMWANNARRRGEAQSEGAAQATDYKAATGVQSDLAGTALDATKIKAPVTDADKVVIDGKEYYKVKAEIDGAEQIVIAEVVKDTAGKVTQATVAFKTEDLNKIIGTIDNETDVSKAGTTIAGILESMSKSKGALSGAQKRQIKSSIEKMFNDNKIHANHYDDLKASYLKIFSTDEDRNFIDTLQAKVVNS